MTLVRWGVWADLVDDKTLWQEQAAGAEVNTQTEVGIGVFFWSQKNKDDLIMGYFSSSSEIVA